MEINHDRMAKYPKSVRRRWGLTLARLVHDTHFDWEELESLCFVFHKLTRQTRGKMSRKTFVDVMYAALDLTHAGNTDYAYKNFDPNNNSFISMEDWCRGLSVVLRGTLDEKVTFCFETYDRQRDNLLKRANLEWMVSENWCTSPASDSTLGLATGADAYIQNELKELLEVLLQRYASNVDLGVTREDYRGAVLDNPLLLQFMGEVLPGRRSVQAFLATFCPRVPALLADS